jgi:hypothetical protein
MKLLSGVAHVEVLGRNHLLGDDTGIRVCSGAHGMVTHVLDAAGDDDVRTA